MPLDYTLLMKRKASKICSKPWEQLRFSELMRAAPTYKEREMREAHLKAKNENKFSSKLRLVSTITNLTSQ